jgi:hypothetical protein
MQNFLVQAARPGNLPAILARQITLTFDHLNLSSHSLIQKEKEKKEKNEKNEKVAKTKRRMTLVDQVADFFRTTHKVKTQQVVESRGQYCGDIELAGYLTNESGPVPLVMDLRIPHDRVGSSTDPSLNGHLKYPNNLDQSLNDTSADKIRKYRADYNE